MELANSFKAELKAAARRGEGLDKATGLPDSMLSKDRDITWYQHAQEYAAARWKRSAGNSRRSIVESLTCVTQVLTQNLRSGSPDADTLRAHCVRISTREEKRVTFRPEESKAIGWVKRASLPISALNDDEVVIDVLDALSKSHRRHSRSTGLLCTTFSGYPDMSELRGAEEAPFKESLPSGKPAEGLDSSEI